MALGLFKATDFRCFESVELELDPSANLVAGPNASGKTSLLEAIAYLGRGKSFRGASTRNLIRHGRTSFVLFGKASADGVEHSIGVRNSADGLETSVDGDGAGGAAALAEALPLQVIDPDVHGLVSGSPEGRRQYLDWLAFHVEHGYLDLWRRFRRSLKQRNAALKSAPGSKALAGWDKEFAGLAEQVAEVRARVFEVCLDELEETSAELLETEVGFDYRRGWPADRSLEELLVEGRERDLAMGSTQAGPQRADLRLRFDERSAKKLVSRGQQKLLACSLVLAGTALVQAELERPMLLLLDDPAAELDVNSLARLMTVVNRLGCQVVATALVPDESLFAQAPALFHVEHGTLERRR